MEESTLKTADGNVNESNFPEEKLRSYYQREFRLKNSSKTLM